jgi:signal transduction histidine kinase
LLFMEREQNRTLETYAPLMLEHLPGGVALFDVCDLRLLAANAQYHALQEPAWQHGRALGHTLMEIVPQELYPRVLPLFHRVAQTGVASYLEAALSTTLEHGVAYWNWAVHPISENDRISYILLTLTEIASGGVARKQAEQEQTTLVHQAVEREPSIRANEQQLLHTVLDQMPVGVLLVESVAGKVDYANAVAAHLLGVPLSDLVGNVLKHAVSLSPHQRSRLNPNLAVRWDFPLVHALWGKTITNQELFVTHPDRSEIVVRGSAAPIRRTDGLISGAVMVFQDITLLKRLEQQRNEFFAVASHELRTPLTIIKGFAELLQMSGTRREEEAMYQYAVTSMLQESEHLSQLVDELLDVSRLEQAKLQMKRSYQDLLTPLRELLNKHIHTAKTHQVFLTLQDLEPTDKLVGCFDSARIEQVMRNLISNAMKYSPAGSEIEVGVRPHRDIHGTLREVLIWVKDQGIGIEAGDLPHIFERFYRSDKRDPSISGFGIGLYVTRALVQEHGGRIWVESTPGVGSIFFVALPPWQSW